MMSSPSSDPSQNETRDNESNPLIEFINGLRRIDQNAHITDYVEQMKQSMLAKVKSMLERENVPFLKAPIIYNLVVCSCCNPIVGCHALFMILIIFIINIGIPVNILITFASDAEIIHDNSDVSWYLPIIRASCWFVLAIQTQEDILRDVYWLIIYFKSWRKKFCQQVHGMPIKHLMPNKRGMCALFISLIYIVSSVALMMASWYSIKSCTTALDIIEACVAYALLIQVDDFMYKYYEQMAMVMNYMTPFELLADMDEAKSVEMWARIGKICVWHLTALSYSIATIAIIYKSY